MDDLAIGLRVERGGRVVYDREYRTSSRRRQFREIPDLIVSRLQQLGEAAPRSKRVRLDHTRLLPPGTVILLGTGLIAPPEAYCRPGVRVTVGCPRLGELTHVVTAG